MPAAPVAPPVAVAPPEALAPPDPDPPLPFVPPEAEDPPVPPPEPELPQAKRVRLAARLVTRRRAGDLFMVSPSEGKGRRRNDGQVVRGDDPG